MEQIIYINRSTGQKEIEDVYCAKALNLVYGNSLISKLVGSPLLHVLIKNPIFSSVYGYLQRLPYSKKKIAPFIKNFKVDASEFVKPVDEFTSFDDFFTRKLKREARPIFKDENSAIIPADGRYLFFQNIEKSDGFAVKGEKFNLAKLLDNEKLAERYAHGTMVMARLCPTDYHRYHFPADCIAGTPKLINGWLYSVNPIAIKKDIHIFTENKRAYCELDTTHFGKVLFMEVGATNVGSINHTFTPGKFYLKGAEKGFFSFGASSLIILFEPGKILLDADLLAATAEGYEILCLMGQSLGKKS